MFSTVGSIARGGPEGHGHRASSSMSLRRSLADSVAPGVLVDKASSRSVLRDLGVALASVTVLCLLVFLALRSGALGSRSPREGREETKT